MVIIRDLQGNIIGKEASAHYTPTRVLRNRHEQALCDKQMGIERPAKPEPTHKDASIRMNLKRAERGLEPIFDSEGVRCGCEDEPCCGC